MVKLLRQLGRFGFVGGAATLTHTSIFVGAIERLGFSAPTAAVLAFCPAVLVSHLGHHYWTFQSDASHRESLPRFAVLAAMGLTLHTLIAWIVVDVLELWYGIALIFGLVVVPTITFVVAKRLVYKPAHGGPR